MYHIEIKSTVVDNADIKRNIVADSPEDVLEKTAELCCQAFEWHGCAFVRKDEKTFAVHELTKSDIDLFITED